MKLTEAQRRVLEALSEDEVATMRYWSGVAGIGDYPWHELVALEHSGLAECVSVGHGWWRRTSAGTLALAAEEGKA